MDTTLIGQRIRSARNRSGMTTEVLAEKIGMATESLGHIEGGVRNTSLKTLIRIADILEVSLDYLTGRVPSPLETMVQLELAKDDLTDAQRAMLIDAARQLVPFIKKYR